MTERDERGSTPAAQPVTQEQRDKARAYMTEWFDRYRIHGDYALIELDGATLEYHLANFLARGVSATGETPQPPDFQRGMKFAANEIADDLARQAPLHRTSCADEEDLRYGNTHCASVLDSLAEEIRRKYRAAEPPAERTEARHEIEVLRCKHCRKLAISVDGIRQDTESCAGEGHGDGKCAGQWTVLVKSAWLTARGKETH